MRRARRALAALALIAAAPAAAEEGAPWAATYFLPLWGAAALSVDLDTRPDGDGIRASVGIDPGSGGCWEGESAPFCDLVDALRAGAPRGGRPDIRVRGFDLRGDRALIAADLPPPGGRVLVALDRSSGFVSLGLHDADGTLQLQGGPEVLPFLCDIAPCMAPEPPPGGWGGGLDWPALWRLIGADGVPAPAGSAPGGVPPLAGTLFERGTGLPLGRIDLSARTGEIVWPGGDGRRIAVVPVVRARGAGGLDLALPSVSGDAADEAAGRLLLAPAPDGSLLGTLITEYGFTEIVLEPFGTGTAGGAPPPEAETEPEPEIDDTPGFGVWADVFALRGVPAGQDLRLRSAPHREAGAVAAVNASAQGLLVLDCDPAVDALAYDRAPPDMRRAALDRVWCRVQVPMAGDAAVEGWVPGRYLDPVR